MSVDLPVIAGTVYKSTLNGRSFPDNNFTSGAIIHKRFSENTTPLALSAGFFLPTLIALHKQLEEQSEKGTEVPRSKVIEILLQCAKDSFVSFADQLARVGVQTGLACAMLRTHTAYGKSVVYLWDMYPRMHQFYTEEVLLAVRLPRFLSTAVGFKPTASDIRVYTAAIPPLAAMEDSAKRALLVLVADIAVDALGFALDRRSRRVSVLLLGAATHSAVAIGVVLGAAAGRAVGGARGEYWGGIAGALFAPSAAARVDALVRRKGRRRSSAETAERRGRSGSKERKPRVSTRRPSSERTA